MLYKRMTPKDSLYTKNYEQCMISITDTKQESLINQQKQMIYTRDCDFQPTPETYARTQEFVAQFSELVAAQVECEFTEC